MEAMHLGCIACVEELTHMPVLSQAWQGPRGSPSGEWILTRVTVRGSASTPFSWAVRASIL